MSRLEFAASVDDLSRTSNFGNPAPINPFVNGPAHYQQQQPILSSCWPYPVMYKPVFEDIDEAATSKQEKIACGVGPSSGPTQKNLPTLSVVGGSEATPNSWPFVVSVYRLFSYIFNVLTNRLSSILTNRLF
jgi:hypothetical protein